MPPNFGEGEQARGVQLLRSRGGDAAGGASCPPARAPLGCGTEQVAAFSVPPLRSGPCAAGWSWLVPASAGRDEGLVRRGGSGHSEPLLSWPCAGDGCWCGSGARPAPHWGPSASEPGSSH